MTTLDQDPHFTFCLADDRMIPRFHLNGVASGWEVAIVQLDPSTGDRLGLLAMATVGEGGWVDLSRPLLVRAGEAFVAVPR